MAETKYTYSIAGDTSDGTLSSPKLIQEVADSAIATALSRINTDGDVLDIWFVDAISAGDETTLDGVVAVHSAGAATTRTFQFWESNPTQSTSLEVYQNAITRTAAPMRQGAYRLSWYCEMRMVATDALTGYGSLRFQVDGTSKGNGALYNEEWQPCSGWDRFWANEGETPELTLDFRRQGGGDDAVEIRRLKLGLEWMGD